MSFVKLKRVNPKLVLIGLISFFRRHSMTLGFFRYYLIRRKQKLNFGNGKIGESEYPAMTCESRLFALYMKRP